MSHRCGYFWKSAITEKADKFPAVITEYRLLDKFKSSQKVLYGVDAPFNIFMMVTHFYSSNIL